MPIRVWLALTLLFPHITQAAEVVQKIRIGLPSLALTYTPFYVAQERGFLFHGSTSGPRGFTARIE